MTPLIYNLFQRLVGPVTRWPEHAERASRMGFNWLYLNPWHYPGFSGSLYAPKEFRRLNPVFAPPGADTYDLAPLEQALRRVQEAGLFPMMDLVVNHTSKDARLADEHPEWYLRDEKGDLVSPFVVDPDDPQKITVWGDLAEIDNQSSPGREELWAYWAELVRDSLRLGFRGFRCDAAYKVPAELWRYLIDEARLVDPEVTFFAETLGAPVEDILALREAGFQFIFNSSKWWNFTEPWALDQQEKFRDIAPSISFPETHDTTRLAADSGGSEAVQRQRYAFAAAFSAGVMMPVGYEFGFRRRVNVVNTMPADWERKSFDISRFVERVNRLKLERPELQGEAALRAANEMDADELLLERSTPVGEARILVNKRPSSTLESRAWAQVPRDGTMFRVCRDDAPAAGEPVPAVLTLDPAEVIYVLPG
jgi:starch synthase (maltosyl-transferring)